MTPRSKKPKNTGGRGSNPADRADELGDAALDRLVGGSGEPGHGGADPWSRPLTDHDLPVRAAKRARRPGKKSG